MTTVSYTQLYTHTGGVRGAVPDDHGELYWVSCIHILGGVPLCTELTIAMPEACLMTTVVI